LTLILGDCLEAMRELPDASVDAVITDPPYGISFMGKHWDAFDIEKRVGKRDVSKLGVRLTGNVAFQEWTRAWASEALRVLKPGGHLLSFAATRTYHRMACGVEEAGFEIRDTLAWMFGSGFPKSLDVAKAIDMSEGIWRGRAGAPREDDELRAFGQHYERTPKGAAATSEAQTWDGWGTALKPAFEPIVLARKPLSGTVAANVLAHGTGALNIDACRIATADHWEPTGKQSAPSVALSGGADGSLNVSVSETHEAGRWPANVLLDDEAAAILDAQTGILTSGPESDRGHKRNADSEASRNAYGGFHGQTATGVLYGDSGGASRFFYCAKVSRAERNAGLDGFEERDRLPLIDQLGPGSPGHAYGPTTRNNHPTVKPIDLMRWLIRLTVRPGGTILDPFGGSGSTGCAAELEGANYILIEREADYMRIIEARTAFWREHGEDGLRICRERDASETRRKVVAEAGQLDLLEAA